VSRQTCNRNRMRIFVLNAVFYEKHILCPGTKDYPHPREFLNGHLLSLNRAEFSCD
jgi:hypothetical protein